MRNLLMILVALGLGTKRHWHIFVAIILGVVIGMLAPVNDLHPATFLHTAFELVGQLFIRLITMLALPLIISSLLIGITSLGDGRQLGKLGVKTIVFFFMTMIIASGIAAAIAYFVNPGGNFPADFSLGTSLVPDTSGAAGLYGTSDKLSSILQNVQEHNLQDSLLSLIPQNPFESLALGTLVPIIIFTLLFGTAMACIGDTARPFIAFFEAVFAATMKMVDWVMIFAVPGVFALTFTVISHAGPQVFSEMMPFIGAVIFALLIQVFVVYPLLLHFLARVHFMDLYRAISEAILVAFGTASSSATLPVSLACIERRAGVSNRIASFVLPTGATMNMNGTTMFEVISVMFIAQLYDIPMTFVTILSIIVLAIVASIGAAGVPSAGLITMAVILNGIGEFRPEQVATGLSLIWAIDRILDMCRTTVNVIDDCAVATLIAASEGELNREMLSSGDSWEDVV